MKFLAHSAALLALISGQTLSPIATAQVVTTQDTTVAGVAGGGYLIYRAQQQIQATFQEISREASRIESEVASLNSQARAEMERASLVERGMPDPQSDDLYKGNMINGDQYKRLTADATNTPSSRRSNLSQNTNRLQVDGAERLAESLSRRTDIRGKEITVTVHKIQGTNNGVANMASPTRLTGSVDEVARQLIEAARQQSPDNGPGSIVKVDLSYNEIRPPNPAEAARLRAAAQGKTQEAEKLKASQEKLIKEVEARNKAKLSKLRMKKFGGMGLVAGALILGFVRHSYAQSLVTLAHGCVNDDAMDTLIVGTSLQSGVSEDEVWQQLTEMCVEE